MDEARKKNIEALRKKTEARNKANEESSIENLVVLQFYSNNSQAASKLMHETYNAWAEACDAWVASLVAWMDAYHAKLPAHYNKR